MGKFVIDKALEFDYGHRVYTQKLNEEFSLDGLCVCRHLHGHRAKVHIFLEGKDLDPQGMVTDFKHLNWAKRFFDDFVDHKFIIDIHDPLFHKIVGENIKFEKVSVPNTDMTAGMQVDMDKTGLEPDDPEFEYLESFFVVDFIPTSENLSKWTFDICQEKMKRLGVNVSRVDWHETPKSKSSYIA